MMEDPTIPLRSGDDPLEALKAMKAQRSAAPASPDPLEQLKALKSGVGNQKLHDEYAVGNLSRRMASENATDDAESQPSYAQRALGGVASLARDIPGAEAMQSGARALVRGQSYTDARNDIRSGEAAAPAVVRNTNRVIGGVVAAAALPGSPVVQGAAYGAASGALQSDPNAGLGTRAMDATTGAAVGAVTGKLADAGSNFVRSKVAPALGKQAMKVDAIRNIVDRNNYGKAAVEAWANGGTSPAIQAALDAPDIKPFAEVIRSSRTMGGADDATVLREAYKLMTERQQNIGKRILNTDDFKAGSELEQQDLNAAKGVLRRAGSTAMPTFPQAIDEHAALKAVDNARTSGSQLAKATLSGKQVGDKKLLRTSADALMAEVPKMTPDEADAALNGLLSRGGDYTSFTLNPTVPVKALFNVTPSAKMTPYIRALEQQRGGASIPVALTRAAVASEGHRTP